MKKLILFTISLFIFCGAAVVGMKKFFPNYFKNALCMNLPFVKNFVQKEFKTYTSIINVKDSMKLVTAKQQLDFINIMDGKDGRYIEIATYEVKAGMDFEKQEKTDPETEIKLPEIEIFSSNKIFSNVIRKEADVSNSQFYTECIKPVNIAYEQKAKDYSVELGLLEKAEKNATEIFKNILGSEKSTENSKTYKQQIDFPYIPLRLEIASDYLEKNNIQLAKLPENQFSRDSIVLENSTNSDWKIRIGDSGRTFSKKFDDFYKNVFETNSNPANSGKDRVEIFRYFDPLYPKESEILSYASDNFKTFFILNEGRIYYIDAECKNDQTLLDTISPTMVYLASSTRKIPEKIDFSQEYRKYTENFFDAAESLRNNEDRNTISLKTERLIKSNISEELTSDEKLFQAVCDVKNLGRKETASIQKTDDSELNEINDLILQLKISPEKYSDEKIREASIETATKLNDKIQKSDNVNLALHQFLENWFLQNTSRFSLSDESRKRYEDDLNSGEIVIASRPLIATKSDSERNKYFFNLFRNRLSMSHFYVDTASRINESLKLSVRGNISIARFNIPEFEEMSDGEIMEKLKKMNNDHEIDNAFVLVFNQKEWDFGDFGVDNDIHALVFDSATLRLFTNIGSQNIGEVVVNKITDLAMKFLRKDNSPEFFFYGDWKRLQVTPENVRIAGQNFGTKKITQSGKVDYRNSNDYGEKSTIAAVIEDLQHAYSNDDTDFYYNTLCENLNYQTQHYVYQKVFRPTPRMILNMEQDKMQRYNY